MSIANNLNISRQGVQYSRDEARLDMKAGGFWTPGVTAFFDVRATHVNSWSNQGKYTATIFKEQENEKRKYSDGCRDGNLYTTGV